MNHGKNVRFDFSIFLTQPTQCNVQNGACKTNRTCSNLMQAMQEVANGIAGICHVIQDNGGSICHIVIRRLKSFRQFAYKC